jgi:hypothetical protein
MKSGFLLFRLPRALPDCVAIITGLLLIGATYQIEAQGYIASAQISVQAVGDGTYNYTIQLNNDSSSMNPIGTFWFAWVPDVYGYDLLTAMPMNLQTPANWGGYVTGGDSYYYADGYGIQFYANGAPLAPGSSLTFGFNSTDSPATLNATSPYFNLPASTSYIYAGYAEGDPGAEIALQVVPEPSSLSLVLVALFGLIFGGRRSLPKFRPLPMKLRAFRKAREIKAFAKI